MNLFFNLGKLLYFYFFNLINNLNNNKKLQENGKCRCESKVYVEDFLNISKIFDIDIQVFKLSN